MKPIKFAHQHFVCTRFRAVLSRGSCAAMFNAASQIRGPTKRADVAYSATRCQGCPIGAEHARGQAGPPSVPPLVQVRASKRCTSGRKCKACGAPLSATRWRSLYCDNWCRGLHYDVEDIARSMELL